MKRRAAAGHGSGALPPVPGDRFFLAVAIVAILVVLFGAAGPVARAADTALERTPSGTVVLRIGGKLTAGSADEVLMRLKAGGFSEVWFASPGGLVAEAYRIGRDIRRRRLATRVPAGATCASACVDAFLGGAVRFVDRGARVVVHPGSVSASEKAHAYLEEAVRQGQERVTIETFEQLSAAGTADWVAYLGVMGASQELARFAAQVPHSCGIVLRPDELIYFNVVNTAGPPRPGYALASPKTDCGR